jgi:hypothetical protein
VGRRQRLSLATRGGYPYKNTFSKKNVRLKSKKQKAQNLAFLRLRIFNAENKNTLSFSFLECILPTNI